MQLKRWLSDSLVKNTAGLIPSTYVVVINCLKLQSQRDPMPFLASLDMHGADTYAGKTLINKK